MSLRSLKITFALLAAVLFAPFTAYAQSIDDLAAQISEASYRDYLDNRLYTHDGDDRGRNGAEHDPCRDSIFDEFVSFGLGASLHDFSYSYYEGQNVIAMQPGTLFPEKIFIVCGHYDSNNNPGADDNASGVAGVLEVARVLSQYEFRSTIMYVAWDLEELGLVGSREWVEEHLDENIRGVVNMDMIAYNPNERNRGEIFSTTRSDSLKFDLADAIERFAPHLEITDGGSSGRSDHYSFERYGFHGVWLAEYDFGRNPHYHRQSDSVDTPGYIDYTFASDMLRGVTAYVAMRAGLLNGDDCLAFDVDRLVGGEPSEFRVSNGTPGRQALIVWGTNDGLTTYRGIEWCVSFGFKIPKEVARNRIVAIGAFDADGSFAVSRYIAGGFAGTAVYLQAATDATCPDFCMSNRVHFVVE